MFVPVPLLFVSLFVKKIIIIKQQFRKVPFTRTGRAAGGILSPNTAASQDPSFYVTYKHGSRNCKDVPQGFEKPELVHYKTPPKIWTELVHKPVF